MRHSFIKILFISLLMLAQSAQAKSLIPKVEAGKPLPSNLFIQLNKAVNPIVVNISTQTTPRSFSRYGGSDPMEELLRQFFGGSQGQTIPQRRPSHSLGTGFIIRKDGLILTNAHVIEKADIIDIQLSEKDDKTYRAKVIGKDSKTDIALIKIETSRSLPVAKLGSSSSLEVGEWVAAFGNPFGHGHSMTKGIVSAIGRDLDEINLLPFIQTDASINPGNSGGPLVNVKGEVIGVNTAIDARAQGIGFAIPIDEVKSLIKQIESTGSVSRGFLGVSMDTMNEEYAENLGTKQKTGALVINVLKNSAASKAGVKPYDIITKFNSKKIKTSGDLAKAVARASQGQTSSMTVIRDRKTKILKVKLGTNQTASVKRPYYKKKRSHETSSSLVKSYGFEIADLTKSLKENFEIQSSGKHKALITRIISYSAASRSGLRAGDMIYEINRKPMFNAKAVRKELSSSKQKSLLLRVKRGASFLLVRLER